MENYKPTLLEWLEFMFEHSFKKQWYETYHAFDIHGVISKPDYRKTEEIGKEFKINYYPYAKETLQFLTKYRPDMILFIFTSSYQSEIDKYMDQFEKDDIFFKYVNENPEISDAKGCFGSYDKKPYFNSYFEDKAGFKPETDWKPIYEYFVSTVKSGKLPNPSWSFKTIETYHEKTKIKTFQDLTDDQLKELVLLRMKNETLYNFNVIEIEEKWETYPDSVLFRLCQNDMIVCHYL